MLPDFFDACKLSFTYEKIHRRLSRIENLFNTRYLFMDSREQE